MPNAVPFTRLLALGCLLCGLLGSGAAVGQALELHFTGVVTDVILIPGTIVGDTVSGSMSFAAGAFVTTSTDGATYDSATHETPSPLSHSTIVFAGGSVFETGTHPGTQYTSVDLSRGVSMPVTGTNIYALSSADEFGPDNSMATFLQLSITDYLGDASQIFSSPAGDVSLLQTIHWLAPDAIALGQFSASGNLGAQFRLTSVDVASTSPVPEPEPLVLLVAGLLAVTGKIRGIHHKNRFSAGEGNGCAQSGLG